ncbi:hypothetical protein SAMN05444392_11828 [Seinonella peptonophila]|uniref:Uncharacterized protein n=1 Tax=Seinonella peptonophila TaxID=112248 RepID=A0A1M5B4X5_9BACL|nr:hypothetical protein [Seinonella peptonophila]SHF37466.1 hypothetical protein SAMN05444392_11828 [Seinonella peptonophila]
MPNANTDEDIKSGTDQLYEIIAICAECIAETIAFAIYTPADSTMNEILLRPNCSSSLKNLYHIGVM